MVEVFRKSGSTSQFGLVREWTSGNEASSMPITVRLEPADEGTLVTLHQPTKPMSDMVYALGGGFSACALFFGMLAAVSPGFPATLAMFMVVVALLGSGAGWGGYRAWVPRQEKRFRALLDRSELIARSGQVNGGVRRSNRRAFRAERPACVSGVSVVSLP